MAESVQFKRRLPHIYIPNQPIFLTWRLKFDLPQQILTALNQIKADYEEETASLSPELQKLQAYTQHKRIFGWLDAEYAKLEIPGLRLDSSAIAGILDSHILSGQDAAYHVDAYCIMPNHVHVLMTPLCDSPAFKTSVSDILRNWKGASAREINLLLNRSGSLWSPETYDHVVRSEEEKGRLIGYIINNPVQASLVGRWQDWSFTWIDDKLRKYLVT